MDTTGDRDRAHPEDRQVHRALSSDMRCRILDALHAEEPLDAARLADRLGLHVNTIRSHLAILEDAGLVASEPEERVRPGRPRLLYRARADAAAARGVEDDRGYRFLAGVLASYLAATGPDAADAGEEAGTAWGRYLVDRPAPFESVTPDAAVERIVGLLDEFGFAPELTDAATAGPRVLLRRCPFLDVATEHRDLVCSLHLGLMRGALAELGSDVEARDLEPFVEPGLCVAHLEVHGDTGSRA